MKRPRVEIDQLLKDAAWTLTDGRCVRFEYPLDDVGKADYALFDRQGCAVPISSACPSSSSRMARKCGSVIKTQDAHFRRVETVFGQGDLARRKAASEIRRDPLSVPIDTRIAGGGGRLRETTPVGVRALHEHQLTEQERPDATGRRST